MKLRFTIFVTLLFVFSNITAQVFWTENFDGTTCAAGSGCDPSIVGWTVVSLGGEGATANKWFVSDREQGLPPGACGAIGPGSQTLHIGNVAGSSNSLIFCPSGDCQANYDAGGPTEITNTRVESTVISTLGQSNVTLNFNYMANGGGGPDHASIWYNDGNGWAILVANLIDSVPQCFVPFGVGKWHNYSTSLPASTFNITNLQIGFGWENNGDSLGTDPSVAIDSINVSNGPPTGFNQLTNTDLTTIYPNPTHGIFTIVNENDFDKVQLLNISGQVVFEDIMKTTKKTTIDITEISNGIYFLKVINKDGFSIQKLTKN